MATPPKRMRLPGLRRLRYLVLALGALFAVTLVRLWLQQGTEEPVGSLNHGHNKIKGIQSQYTMEPTARRRPKPIQRPGVQVLQDLVVGGGYNAQKEAEYRKLKYVKQQTGYLRRAHRTPESVPRKTRDPVLQPITTPVRHQSSADGKVERAASTIVDLGVIEVKKEDLIKALKPAKATPPAIKTIRPIFPDAYNCTKGSIPYVGTSFRTEKYCLLDDQREYFKMFENLRCYLFGTDLPKTERRFRQHKDCSCKDGWHGMHCSMPEIVFKGGYPYQYGVDIVRPLRRIIYGFPFHGEFDMLETRLHTVGDAVDVYLILESNYTAAGKPKERALLKKLKEGYLKEFQHKIVYVSLDYFPKAGYANGWAIDGLLRNQIGYVGLERVLENVRDRDLFILSDADEIILPEAFMFLKLHFGYPEPFGFILRHSVFGYFWQAEDKTIAIYGGCSIAFLRDVLGGKVYDIRSAPRNTARVAWATIDKFKRRSGVRVKSWEFGGKALPVGWHCSWCFLPAGIQNKLLSAHAADFPRWGTFPEKTTLPFIRDLVKMGLWFDEKTRLHRFNQSEPYYAPDYIRNRPKAFAHLLNLKGYMDLAGKKTTIISNEPAT